MYLILYYSWSHLSHFARFEKPWFRTYVPSGTKKKSLILYNNYYIYFFITFQELLFFYQHPKDFFLRQNIKGRIKALLESFV